MRILHTADWQIGRSYSQFEADDAAQLQQARIAGVQRIAQLATKRQVDVVLVAGDVFDVTTPRAKTMARLFEAMVGFKGPWLLLPGNHDAATTQSLWDVARTMPELPANARLCLRPEVVEVRGAQGQIAAVLTAPLTQRHTHLDVSGWFDQAETPEGAIRIGLAHGSVDGLLMEDAGNNNPIAADRAARARLDYLALGDWHGKKQVNERTWYSGTHEPERFKDNDPGYVLIVDIDAPGAVPRVEPVYMASYQWRTLDLQVQGDADVEQAQQALAEVDARTVVDVRLSGHCDMGAMERLLAALADAQRRAAASTEATNELSLAPSEEELQGLQADGFVGEALKELKQQLTGAEAPLARDALLALARIQRQVQGQVAPAGGVPGQLRPGGAAA